MSYEIAIAFFDACETPLGWEGCQEFCEEGATFVAQSEPLADMTQLSEYCDWMFGFGTVTAKGASYTLHTKAWDEDTKMATFFATYHATHVGEGGPVPPTGQSTNSHYVYVVEIGESGKVKHLTKIWNAPWAMNELQWM